MKKEPNQQLINDIGTALRFVDEDYHYQKISLVSMLENQEITWELLWAVFPPKVVVLAPGYGVMEQEQAFKLTQSGYRERPDGSKYFLVQGSMLHADGRGFGFGPIKVEIDPYEGARNLGSLDAFPLSYHGEQKAIWERLVSRGRKYISLLGRPICKDYPVTCAVKEIIQPNGEHALKKFNVRLSIYTSSAPGVHLLISVNRPKEESWSILKGITSITPRQG